MYSDGTKDSEITSVNPDPLSELNISYPQYSFIAALYVCVCGSLHYSINFLS